jgi:transcriptional regulator with XRE-family HTH domain
MTMEFAVRLQALRKARGMSQEDLADAVGVSRQAVSKWESGQSYPEMDKLVALSELFNVSLDYLVKGTPGAAEGNAAGSGGGSAGYYGMRPFEHYEYKSRRRLFGLPLVHINVGRGLYRAKGIVAIGTVATGFVSIGALSLGIVSVGALSAGVLSFAAASLGLLASIGGLAIGALAMGGLALGIVTLGGLSVGMFSVGGCAIASDIAVGGYASGHIAIGDVARGAYTILAPDHNLQEISRDEAARLIGREYPNLWKPIVDLLTGFFK